MEDRQFETPSQLPTAKSASTMAATDESISKASRKRSRSVSESSGVDVVVQRDSTKKHKDNRRGRNDRQKSYGRQSHKNTSTRGMDKKVATNNRKNRKAADPNEPKPIYAADFSKEEVANEQRRPKKKCAVMVGYCGTGYHGLQIMNEVKTIEGDLFEAFVAAGAISKANADDPKKSQLVRCARTDKGVHAAGNVLSLKLIIEDKDIIEKINSHLPPQIRIWGITPTVNSFNSYQQCDSRIYEYLIPTHVFLPPHPRTFLAMKLDELAEEATDVEGYRARQADAAHFWPETELNHVKPVIEVMDPILREQAVQNVFLGIEVDANGDTKVTEKQNNAAGVDVEGDRTMKNAASVDSKEMATSTESNVQPSKYTPLEAAVRSIKAAHLSAKHAYRISPTRLERVRSVFAAYEGTHPYHNYTINKKFGDPSCKRHIKSFKVSTEPFLIGDTEWISLKVHGQSFMMHQIRKMVMMAVMLVRCGADGNRIKESFICPKMIIPRAPALGLLLERPIFDAYNKYGRHKAGTGNEREPIVFDKYTKEMDAFKQQQIYERMWKDEREQQVFVNIFGGLDSLRSVQLLWASSLGTKALDKQIDGAIDLGTRVQEEEKEDGVAEDS